MKTFLRVCFCRSRISYSKRRHVLFESKRRWEAGGDDLRRARSLRYDAPMGLFVGLGLARYNWFAKIGSAIDV